MSNGPGPGYSFGAPGAASPSDKPSSWLVPAIVTTLCCFPITGVIGTVFASQVEPLWTSGRADEAVRAAHRARFWVLLGFILWAVLMVVGVATGLFMSWWESLRP